MVRIVEAVLDWKVGFFFFIQDLEDSNREKCENNDVN